MSPDIVDLVMADKVTPYIVWTNTIGLFNNNKTNIKKGVANAIAKFGTPMLTLSPTVIKGLHERFDSVADIAPSSRHSHRSSCSATCCFSKR
jgi:hypothetical protein